MIPGKVIFRPATLMDAPVLAGLRWDFQREEENSPPILTKVEFLKVCITFFETGLASGTWQHWLVEVGGKPVAQASLKLVNMIPRPNRPKDTFGYLTNVYTVPEFRNQGIGTELLQMIKNWSISEGMEVVIVWPSEKSRVFYQRLGFEASEEIMELGIRDL